MNQSASRLAQPEIVKVRPASILVYLPRMFSRRWLLATILAILAAAVMIRLGIWQLDRLEQRRSFNTRVMAQINQPVLDLNQPLLPGEIESMEYHPVVVRGVYDHSQQVLLLNQAWENQVGVHLLTPLRIEGTDRVVLVDRGWAPSPDFDYANTDWSQYDEAGLVTAQGVLRGSQSSASFGPQRDQQTAGEERVLGWYFPNLPKIAAQLPYAVLPVYVQQAPEAGWSSLPNRTQPDVEITEGPHMGYAIQWFGFAALLAFGYPFFIRRQETEHPNHG
jgi:surfeit locus 1 family protein